MIKVLVVEDSAVARELISQILSTDPEMTVIGTAADGAEALDFVSRIRPDVITMDIIMPKMDGFEATRRIMETNPIPIVIVSASLVKEEVEKTWRAVEAGAVAVLEKPRYSDFLNRSGDAAKLVQTVKLMSQVKVVRRWKKSLAPKPVESAPIKIAPRRRKAVKAVVMGASTGGPQTLQRILSMLPATYPVPILVVQHITPGFTAGFVDWLDRSCSLKVRIGTDGERAIPGTVYVAPDGLQMKIDNRCRIAALRDDPENGLRPAVAYLFRSAALAFGDCAVGVLLTGMGRDGAAELKQMRDRGAVTIAQDKTSSIIYGMPGEAMKLEAAEYSFSPEQIADMLCKLVG